MLFNQTIKQGTFGCFEVTIGFNGNERVDYMTYDTKGIWRCYEIKVSKSDFHSKAKKTFIGNYNYYVMPPELYEEVKDEIPKNIGVHNGICVVKNAKKQQLSIDEQVLKDSMIRSLFREFEKQYKSGDETKIIKLQHSINYYKNQRDKLDKSYDKLQRKIINKYGYDALADLLYK